MKLVPYLALIKSSRMSLKEINKWQFGDFQTPAILAEEVVDVLIRNHNVHPDMVIEPSCGQGTFLLAALKAFPNAKVVGFEVNPIYVAEAQEKIKARGDDLRGEAKQGDFFNVDWETFLRKRSGNLLILGNPPWVTSSELGMINSQNLPSKCNFQNRRGIEAITGSGNFDISEWMILRNVDWVSNRNGSIAVLCKYAVARKVMRQIRYNNQTQFFGHIYQIDAKKYFDASVNACLFVLTQNGVQGDCEVYESLNKKKPSLIIGKRDGYIINDVAKYKHKRHLLGHDLHYKWRSGLKHDCSKVMELKKLGDKYENGYGELFRIENNYTYPLLKGSDIGNCRTKSCRKYVIVTQKHVGESTEKIKVDAPMTWKYLQTHSTVLNQRRSSIFKGKPPYSIFGIGDYAFKPWKIAISCLYKELKFCIVGPIGNRPVMFDDTVAFLSFETEAEANFILKLLKSKPATDFLTSMIFWDEKRPITINILRRLSLRKVAAELNFEETYIKYISNRQTTNRGQLELAIAEQHGTYKP